MVLKHGIVREIIRKDLANEAVYWLEKDDYNRYGMGLGQIFG